MSEILAKKRALQVHITLNVSNGKGQKLRMNMMIHVGLVCFNFHLPKINNVFMCMSVGTRGNVDDNLKPLFSTSDPPNYSK